MCRGLETGDSYIFSHLGLCWPPKYQVLDRPFSYEILCGGLSRFLGSYLLGWLVSYLVGGGGVRACLEITRSGSIKQNSEICTKHQSPCFKAHSALNTAAETRLLDPCIDSRDLTWLGVFMQWRKDRQMNIQTDRIAGMGWTWFSDGEIAAPWKLTVFIT